MNDDTTPPSPSLAPVRPPDFVLPRADGVLRPRPGEPLVYVTWGGEIYGPATAEDVLAGVRSSSFDESAHFWFEGRDEWTPVAEFQRVMDSLESRLPAPRPSGTPQQAHHNEPAERREPRKRSQHRAEHPRAPKKPRIPGRSNQGYWLVAGFILLAIGLTVGILLLIWRFI